MNGSDRLGVGNRNAPAATVKNYERGGVSANGNKQGVIADLFWKLFDLECFRSLHHYCISSASDSWISE
jgi:hypothetical protein